MEIESELMPLSAKLVNAKAEEFAPKRRYTLGDYRCLIGCLTASHKCVTWKEAMSPQVRGERIATIRHDVDHDLFNARRLAREERQLGIRSTYCLMPTAWYYRHPDGDTAGWRTRDVVEIASDIRDLGHEISLHNNSVVEALVTGKRPAELLEDELSFWLRQGIVIHGTSSHGDRLCRELNFRNFEVFAEFVGVDRLQDRVLRHGDQSVELGATTLAELGLEYEAYELRRDLYVSDSGGQLRKKDAPVIGERRMEPKLDGGSMVGLLVHPIWWDLEIPEARNEEDMQSICNLMPGVCG